LSTTNPTLGKVQYVFHPIENIKIKMNRIVIFPFVLYGCEIWSLKLRKGHRLRVFENGVLGKIFEPKGHEVKKEWRKLHNEELNDLYCTPNFVRVIKSRRMRWAVHVARMGEGRSAYRVLVRFLRETGKFPRPRRRWEVDIKKDLQES
jgi:hypothetical protein